LSKAGNVAEASASLSAFESMFRDLDTPVIKELLKDLRASKEGEGQIGMAPAHFGRWGEHYMRAYLRAQELQQCMNFKDPGLQIYGGELFHALQEEGDKQFCELPPPTPTRTSYYGSYGSAAAAAVPASMAIFHNASGGCFAPETYIAMDDGKRKMICDMKRGDRVWTPTGPATVRALVICGSYARAQPMTQLSGGLVITPFHPVRRHATGGDIASLSGDSEAHPVRRSGATDWQFPSDISGYTDRIMPTVYNLVLDSGHIVHADGWEALTLGHGFTEPIAAHDYFGTERVINDLMAQPGWAEGRPAYKNLRAKKDPHTGLIIGWVDDI
jgi:hypothetical protein